jgi:hypothetical protein
VDMEAKMPARVLDEAKLAKFIDDQLSKCKKDAYELQAYLNISYFAGKQWIKVDRSSNRLVEPPLEPWQVRFTANKIQPIVRTELAKITKNKFVMYVNPATSDDNDVRAARVAEKVVSWLEYELGLQEKDRENCLWGLCTGISFMKPYWNPKKGREIRIPEDLGGGTIYEGDVDSCVVPLFELKFDTSCSKWADISWICHDKIRTLDYIKEVYGIEAQAETGLTATSLYEAKLQTLSTSGVSYQKCENSAVVHEYWELPSSDYPKGRRITKIGHQIPIYEEDIGFGEEDDTERELPFFPFFHINVPGRLIPTSIVEQLIPIQREYNKSRSQIIENKNLVGNPILMAPIGSLDEEPTNEPGQYLEYNPGAGPKPDYLTPPTMSAEVYKNIDLLDGEFEFVSGQHETSHGTTPAGVTSGTAIGYLQEQDDTKLGPTIANFISCKQKYMRYLLKMIQKKYDFERTVRIAGDDRRAETLRFKGSDLTSIDVRVNEGTMYQTSKAAMQDFIIKMVQYGLLLPTNERDRQLIMKVLEFGVIDDVYTEFEQDTSQAQAENDKFQRGVNSDVRDFYNHEAHVKEHNKLRKSEMYQQLPPEIKQAIDAHVDLHLQSMANRLLGTAPPAQGPATQESGTQPMMQEPMTQDIIKA